MPIPSAWRLCAAALVIIATATPGFAAEPARYLEGFRRASAMIETPAACHLLEVYLALTPEQRAQGLMNIRELGEYEGMLFPNAQPVRSTMWMKNTYISLDLLYIAADQRIAGITAHTTPLSEATLVAPAPVTGILELNGGFAERHAVSVGDRFTLLDLAP